MSRVDLEKIENFRRDIRGEGKEIVQPRAVQEVKKSLKKHVVESGETLSHIALKYYGSASKEKWMVIYAANKNLIGDNPNKIRIGQELVIPEIE